MSVRLIAMDMDGTLLDEHSLIPERNLKALRAAKEQGVVVAIDSGRYAENILAVLEEHHFSCPVIATNGTKVVTEDGKILGMHAFSPETAAKLRGMLKDSGCLYYIYGPDFLAVSDKNQRHHSEIRYGETIEKNYHFTFHHGEDMIEQLITRPILKFYICDNGHLPEMREMMKNIPDVFVSSSGITNLELTPAGFDKATGVMELAAIYGIGAEDVMTFGDQENDLPMLKAAGWGTAMGNAPDEIKQQVRYVTETNTECGVARAIERYVLKSEE